MRNRTRRVRRLSQAPLASLLALTAAATAAPAAAQRTQDNAIADAEDAFGSNDGGENLGLYGPTDVRGFSPIAAGNVRLEGVYFDRQGDLNSRLTEGNRVRVGPSAATYAFPAPSGVVDYRLRMPGQASSLSAVIQGNSFGGGLVEVDAALPLAETLSVGGGVSHSRSEYASGNNADVTHLAAVAHWRPAPHLDAKVFWSRTRIADEDIFPIILGDGSATPERLVRRRFLGQPWADVETVRYNYGAIARGRLAGFGVRAGLFRSINEVTEGHSVFLEAAAPGALSPRTVSAYPGRRGASTSGELGLAREFDTGALTHRLQLLARGRAQDRRYGGAQRIALPPAPFGEPLYVERPSYAFGPQTDDRVRQWSIGLGYQAEYAEVGQINVGLQKVDYRKRVVTPGAAPRPETRERPWLFNVAGGVQVRPGLSLSAGYTRGLEESDVAPDIALNRDEAPPAIRTRQLDGGVKVELGRATLIAGAFQIERPYYGVDDASVFRRLGAVRHRGVETSITGSPIPGLTLVAGSTFLDAQLSGDEVDAGQIGRRPVGVPRRKAILNLDWRPPGSSTSVDLAIQHIGPTMGDALNRVRVGAYATVDLGLRHRFQVGEAPAVLRIQATNLFDSYGWEVAGANAFVYTQPRLVSARLTVDF